MGEYIKTLKEIIEHLRKKFIVSEELINKAISILFLQEIINY